MIRLACGHHFHDKCIKQVVDSRPRDELTCPVCRKPLPNFKVVEHGEIKRDDTYYP